MRRARWLWLLVPPVLWFAVYEPVDVVVPGTPPMQVRANEHAAASRLLGQWGLETRRILTPGALFPLPDTDILLILQSHREALTVAQAKRLREWTRRGGRLLVTARPLPRGRDETSAKAAVWQNNDPLLFPMAVSAWRTEAPEPPPSVSRLVEQYLDAGTLFQKFCLNASAEMKERCEDVMCRHHQPWHDSYLEEHRRRLGLDAGLAIHHPHLQGVTRLPGPEKPVASSLNYQAGNQWGQQLVSLRLGQGELVVLSGLSIWNNDQLHLLDHAWLLRKLSEGKQGVWFVQNMDMPSLARWLWQQAWPVIVSLVIVLVVFLWQRVPRRGTLLQPESFRERDFLEHLSASSRFLWRTGNRQTLLAALRRHVINKLRTHPVANDDAARWPYLARHTATGEDDIRRAMTQTPQSRDELTEFTQTLQTLRNRL